MFKGVSADFFELFFDTAQNRRKFIQNDFDGLVNKPEKRIKQFQKYLPKPDKKLMTEHPPVLCIGTPG